MKSKVLVSVLLVVVVITAILALSACNIFKTVTAEEVENNLRSAYYEVTVKTGKEYVESDENTFNLTESELTKYIYAVNGEEKIYVFVFDTIKEAELNSNFIMIDGMKSSGQNNKILYYGTKQAVKDAGL